MNQRSRKETDCRDSGSASLLPALEVRTIFVDGANQAWMLVKSDRPAANFEVTVAVRTENKRAVCSPIDRAADGAFIMCVAHVGRSTLADTTVRVREQRRSYRSRTLVAEHGP